jgi:hypothetical protein
MGKYKVENSEDQIKITEIPTVHKLNTTHTIYRETNEKYIVAISNVANDENYDIEDNIIAEINFTNVAKRLEGLDNADLLEIVLDRLKTASNMTLYNAEAIHSITNALVYLSMQKTDTLIETAKKIYEMQQQQQESTETEDDKEEESNGNNE